MTNKLRSDADALKDINTTDAEKKKKSRLRNAVGATVLTVAGMVGFGVAGENDRQAEELTRQNNEQIMNAVTQKGGGSIPEIEVPVKGGDGGSYVNEEGKHIEVVISPEGHEVHIDVATGQVIGRASSVEDEIGHSKVIENVDPADDIGPVDSSPSNNSVGGHADVPGATDPATKEAEVYENSDDFATSDGQPSVDTERDANSDG